MSLVQPILCDWDATSIRGGVSSNRDTWVGMLQNGHLGRDPIHVQRRLGAVAPLMLQAQVEHTILRGLVPLVLGGDHDLTWNAHAALRAIECADPVWMLHFDAHHDSWRTTTVANYSVMDHIRRTGTRVVSVGVREHCSPAGLALLSDPSEIPTGARVHVTVDLDVLDPARFASVTFPVAAPTPDLVVTPEMVVGIVTDIATRSRVRVIDMVEWRAPEATPDECRVVAYLLKELVEVIDAADRRDRSAGGTRS